MVLGNLNVKPAAPGLARQAPPVPPRAESQQNFNASLVTGGRRYALANAALTSLPASLQQTQKTQVLREATPAKPAPSENLKFASFAKLRPLSPPRRLASPVAHPQQTANMNPASAETGQMGRPPALPKPKPNPKPPHLQKNPEVPTTAKNLRPIPARAENITTASEAPSLSSQAASAEQAASSVPPNTALMPEFSLEKELTPDTPSTADVGPDSAESLKDQEWKETTRKLMESHAPKEALELKKEACYDLMLEQAVAFWNQREHGQNPESCSASWDAWALRMLNGLDKNEHVPAFQRAKDFFSARISAINEVKDRLPDVPMDRPELLLAPLNHLENIKALSDKISGTLPEHQRQELQQLQQKFYDLANTKIAGQRFSNWLNGRDTAGLKGSETTVYQALIAADGPVQIRFCQDMLDILSQAEELIQKEFLPLLSALCKNIPPKPTSAPKPTFFQRLLGLMRNFFQRQRN